MAAYSDSLIRAQFPELSSTTQYPEALLSGYWAMATNFISPRESPFNAVKGNSLALALNYLTAHLLVLGQQAASGPQPGSKQGGFQTGSSTDELSITKLDPPAKTAWQWWLAQTTYGQSLWSLISVKSVGGFSVGGIAERESFRKAGGVFW
jgi:hypothetical protein